MNGKRREKQREGEREKRGKRISLLFICEYVGFVHTEIEMHTHTNVYIYICNTLWNKKFSKTKTTRERGTIDGAWADPPPI